MKYLKEFELSLNGVMGETVTRILEAENPMYIGGNQNSPIPGTPPDLQPQPDPKVVRKKKRNEKKMEKWVSNSNHP